MVGSAIQENPADCSGLHKISGYEIGWIIFVNHMVDIKELNLFDIAFRMYMSKNQFQPFTFKFLFKCLF